MTDVVVKSFVKSFVGFLKLQCDDRKLNSDQMESVEVAIDCLQAAFELSNDESTTSNESPDAAMNQIDIFEVFQTMYLEKKPENKELAEDIKNEGNRLMKENKYYEALQQYNRAIIHDPRNPVLYCNRAAAQTRLGDHEKAVADCKLALAYNPQYSKAYGRMGIAYSNLSKFDLARSSYQKAIELEPENQDYANNLMVAEQKLAQGNLGASQGTGGAAGAGNFNNILLDSLNNPGIGTFIRDMMQDPMVTSALQSFASNPEAMMNVSRQFADHLNNASPDILNSLRGVMGGNLPPNFPGNDGSNNPGSDNNQQQPPPSS